MGETGDSPEVELGGRLGQDGEHLSLCARDHRLDGMYEVHQSNLDGRERK